MKIIKLLFVILVPSLMVSCRKDDKLGSVDNIPGLGGDTWAQGPIDKWIYDSLTVRYNITVKYKWDQFELELDKTLVPPKEDKVIPVMSTIRKVWLESYVAEGGELFFKRISPKFFSLVGSASYNRDGTATLGTAEGGRKVVLYLINYFRVKGMPGYVQSDSLVLKEMIHVIEHEFGHILHQNVLYPPEFKRISPGLYTTDWINTSDAEANNDGYITAYSMSASDEDFVEMIALMLTLGRTGFDNLVNNINYTGVTDRGTTATVAKARLREKETIVVNYFKQVWNINFYNLQSRTRQTLSSFIY